MDRSLARRIVLAALAVGLLAELAMDGPAVGLNVPLVTATMLAGAWLFRRSGRAPDPLDAWLPGLGGGPRGVRRRCARIRSWPSWTSRVRRPSPAPPWRRSPGSR